MVFSRTFVLLECVGVSTCNNLYANPVPTFTARARSLNPHGLGFRVQGSGLRV